MSELTKRIRARCIEDGDCLIWQGYSLSGRNPQIKYQGKVLLVRRVLWEAKNGPIPAGKHIAVTCSTPNCVHHIQAETCSETQKRAGEKGMYSTPQRCAKIAATKQAQCSPLTLEQVQDIRYGPGTAKDAALRHGVGHTTAAGIRRGDRWKEYSSPFTGLGARA